jgi:hypothetical protein
LHALRSEHGPQSLTRANATRPRCAVLRRRRARPLRRQHAAPPCSCRCARSRREAPQDAYQRCIYYSPGRPCAFSCLSRAVRAASGRDVRAPGACAHQARLLPRRPGGVGGGACRGQDAAARRSAPALRLGATATAAAVQLCTAGMHPAVAPRHLGALRTAQATQRALSAQLQKPNAERVLLTRLLTTTGGVCVSHGHGGVDGVGRGGAARQSARR